MPVGVTTTVATRPAGDNVGVAPAATFFVAGLTERGDTANAVKVRSMAEFATLFGDRVSYGYVWDALAAYFGEGGTQAYVARVVGAAATVGALVLKDRAGAGGVNTVNLTARSAGAWSANVSVQVVDGPSLNTYALLVFYKGLLVEQYQNLPDPATLVARINAQSLYLVAADAGSATVAPTNNPAVLAATPLTAGADDRATVTAASDANAAVARYTGELGPGITACPGYDGLTVGPILAATAGPRGRLVALAPPQGSTATGARTSAAAVRSIAGSEALGMFYPWVQVPDGAGGVRTIPPEGFVAGVRARAHVQVGPWQAPAGEHGRARYIIGLETVLDKATADALNDDQVNTIRLVAGAVKLYGWRSMNAADPANYRFLSSKDVLNYVAGLGNIALEQFVFDTIDGAGHLFDRIATTMRGIVEPIHAAGGLYEKHQGDDPNGALVDPGYSIDAGPGVNTPAAIQAGNVGANVGLRPSPTAELIVLTLTRVGLTQAA
jgi:hypothetical protein